MHGFRGVIAVDALGAPIPGGDPFVDIQQEERIILHPRGRVSASTGSRSTRRLRAGNTLVFAMYSTSRGAPSGPESWSDPSCSPSFSRVCQRSGITCLYLGRCEIIQAVADDLFPRQTQEFAGAGTSIPILAIIVSDQDRGGRLKYDCAEQQLKFFGAVLEQPG